MHDAYNLKRFVDAQDPVFDAALGELERGHKRTHWMWFVFPQLAALGSSAMAKHFGIHSLDEARAYLRHPILGERLRRCCEVVADVQVRTAYEIFGYPDELKFKSCLTLFELAAPQEALFARCLEKYYGAERDGRTLALVQEAGAQGSIRTGP